MWNLSHRNRTPFTHLHEIFRKFMWNLSQVYMRFFISLCEIFCKLKKYMYLCIGFGKSPDGGIGRRAGLKHQCRKASRFEPGSGYYKSLENLWFTRDFSFSTCTKSVLFNKIIGKVYFIVFHLLVLYLINYNFSLLFCLFPFLGFFSNECPIFVNNTYLRKLQKWKMII